MDSRVGARVRRAFTGIGPQNPLAKLNNRDRESLWALLAFYERTSKNPLSDPWEEIEKLAAQFEAIASRLDHEAFKGSSAEILAPFLSSYEDLPERLTALSALLRRLAALHGKPGHKSENFSTQILVTASEFVRLRTKRPNDEHLAELLQAIDPMSECDNLSGDAIRKKRAYLRKNYPALYGLAIERAETMCQPPPIPSV
jgi:oligoendopeptidase F